jgi:signal transduction histidine kinase
MEKRRLASLLRRTYWISFIAIAAIALTVIAVAFAQRGRERWTQHSRDMARLARKAQLLALDRETGVRGFLLSGDSASLAPDAAARLPLRLALDSLVAGTADNPGQQRRAAAFAEAIARWDSLFVKPALADRVDGDGSTTMSFGPNGLAGKVLFDDVRLRFIEFESEEEALYRSRSRAALQSQTLDVTVTVLGLVLLAATQAALRRRVVRQATLLEERQTQLEEQAMELEEQASELEEQATELETQTEELQETVTELGRKNDELDAFSASVAHDLRSPLRSIDGFSHLLITDYADRLDDGGVSALKRIRTNAQRMGELIDGLLSLARVSAVDLRRADVNLSDLATMVGDDVHRAMAAERSIAYVVQRGLTAHGDARLLRLVLQNLVENAVKFTRSRSDAWVEVGSRVADGDRAFFVADNGVGFDMQHAVRLFDAFERLHDDQYEGTGIGLATVRRIVERHGGRLWAESEPGRGATFYFTIPGEGR